MPTSSTPAVGVLRPRDVASQLGVGIELARAIVRRHGVRAGKLLLISREALDAYVSGKGASSPSDTGGAP